MAKLTWRGAEAEVLVKKTAMRAIADGAEHILTEAIDETPIDTGTLRRSGAVTEAPTEMAVYVSFNTPYAVAVHEGFGPREIKAVEAKVLAVPSTRWKGGTVNPYGSGKLPQYSKDGRFVILGKAVCHPGFKGKKYLETPFNRNKAKVSKLVDDQVKSALNSAR